MSTFSKNARSRRYQNSEIADAPYCGLDFGTSNSTLGLIQHHQPVLVNLENDKPLLRSAILFEQERVIFGCRAIDEYLELCEGRLLVALKSILGSSTMEETTYINGKQISYKSMIAYLFRHMKEKGEQAIDANLDKVVIGRPVRFNDNNDNLDKKAEQTLEEIAKAEGFKEVAFQFEPIAAALHYEQSLKKEEIAFIADIGGGTSDFTVIKLGAKLSKPDRNSDVLSNEGIHIGGTDLDKSLSLYAIMPHLGLDTTMRGLTKDLPVPSFIYHELTSWHKLNTLYSEKTIKEVTTLLMQAYDKPKISRLLSVLKDKLGHKILNTIEISKRALSETDLVPVNLEFIEKNLSLLTSRHEFESCIEARLQSLKKVIDLTIENSGLKNNQIHSIFLTGGTGQIPIIQTLIKDSLPQARFIKGDIYGSVGLGLTLDAQSRWQ